VLGQPAAALAALSGLRSLEVTESYSGYSVAVEHLQLSALKQLTSLRLLGRSEVPAKRMQQLPGDWVVVTSRMLRAWGAANPQRGGRAVNAVTAAEQHNDD
jgi:hypothetical protein